MGNLCILESGCFDITRMACYLHWRFTLEGRRARDDPQQNQGRDMTSHYVDFDINCY